MSRRIYNVTDNIDPGEFPAALAIGDSWFWYPNQNLMRQLIALPSLKDDHSTIQLLGFNGASLAEYVGKGQYAGKVDQLLKKGWREGYSEFYVSGAGNDAVHLKLALKDDCKGITTAVECFEPERLRMMLRDISSAIGSLIHNIQFAYKDDNKPMKLFFIHGYDYPVPDGRGFLNHSGWLKPPLDQANVERNPTLRNEIVKYLIDKLNDDVFSNYHSPSTGVFYIDTRRTLSRDVNTYRDDWANEMHPTSEGFAKIAHRWLPVLRQAGLAT